MRLCRFQPASSPEFHVAARALGETLASNNCTIVYGGGSQGLMGSLADGALSRGGEVIGILPKFMADLEWGRPGLTHLDLVEDMRERKQKLLTGSDAVVALPGGCGTLEELFEAITLKRLGLYFNPILLLNTRDFYSPLQSFLQHVEDRLLFTTVSIGIAWIDAGLTAHDLLRGAARAMYRAKQRGRNRVVTYEASFED